MFMYFFYFYTDNLSVVQCKTLTYEVKNTNLKSMYRDWGGWYVFEPRPEHLLSN